jgi:hypothetical protein
VSSRGLYHNVYAVIVHSVGALQLRILHRARILRKNNFPEFPH